MRTACSLTDHISWYHAGGYHYPPGMHAPREYTPLGTQVPPTPLGTHAPLVNRILDTRFSKILPCPNFVAGGKYVDR